MACNFAITEELPEDDAPRQGNM